MSEASIVGMDGEKIPLENINISICPTHTRENWTKHTRYTYEGNSVVKCMDCPWGTSIPGYMRCVEGKIVDLRG